MSRAPRAKTEGAGVSLQFAAMPFRIVSGAVEVLLITSRETHRWIIPKGWPMRGLPPREVAAREAFEEAGLVGTIVGKHAIGSYHYIKRLPDGQQARCHVKVFLLSVDHQADDWQEKAEREWRWLSPEKAAGLVEESGLAELLVALNRAMRPLTPKRAKPTRLPRDPNRVSGDAG